MEVGGEPPTKRPHVQQGAEAEQAEEGEEGWQSRMEEGDEEKEKRGKGRRQRVHEGPNAKQAEVLRSWMFARWEHPFPNEDEKRALCAVTGLSMRCVTTWFNNKRARIWKPWIAAARDCASPINLSHSS